MKVSELININGKSQVEIVFEKTETESPLQRFQRMSKVINDGMIPILKAYIDSLELNVKLQEVKTLEELEVYSIEYFTPEILDTLSHKIDTFDDLKDHQKVFLFMTILNTFTTAITNRIDGLFQLRAQEIANSKKRIITSK